MNDQDLAATLCQTAREVFAQPSVEFGPTLAFRDIPGFNSILAIQYILAIETAFSITLTEDEVDRMHTMGDLKEILRTKLGA